MIKFNKATKTVLLVLSTLVLNFVIQAYISSQMLSLDCNYQAGSWFCGLGLVLWAFVINLILSIYLLNSFIPSYSWKIVRGILIGLLGLVLSNFLTFATLQIFSSATHIFKS
jgi:hypothetical protein